MPEVYLAPSVRHFNQGFGTYGTEEERMNLIADLVELELVRNGLSVARNDPRFDLTATVAEGNASGADIYVALRSVSRPFGERGSRVYYYRSGSNGQRLAEEISAFLAQVTPTEDEGPREGASAFGGLGYYELRKTRMPAVIIEIGNHNDPMDADFIVANSFEIAVAIAKGILAYFALPYTPLSEEEATRLQNEYNNVYL